MGQMRNLYKIFMGKTEGKRPHGRPRRRWEYNIKVDLKHGGRTWTTFNWPRIGQMIVSYEHCNGFLGFVIEGKFGE
jgi:hypothetical protein